MTRWTAKYRLLNEPYGMLRYDHHSAAGADDSKCDGKHQDNSINPIRIFIKYKIDMGT